MEIDEQVARDRERKENYKLAFSSPEGHKVLIDLVNRFGHRAAPMIDFNKPDPLMMAFKEGQRSVMMHVGFQIEAAIAEDETEGVEHDA